MRSGPGVPRTILLFHIISSRPSKQPPLMVRISTGLINQNYWENSKWYYVNVERGNAADRLKGRNINVSFTKNFNVPIEVMVFIFFSDEITIDVKTGLTTRHKN